MQKLADVMDGRSEEAVRKACTTMLTQASTKPSPLAGATKDIVSLQLMAEAGRSIRPSEAVPEGNLSPKTGPNGLTVDKGV